MEAVSLPKGTCIYPNIITNTLKRGPNAALVGVTLTIAIVVTRIVAALGFDPAGAY